MFRPYVLMIQPFCLFRAIGKNTFAFVAERQIHGRRNFFAGSGVCPLNLLPD